MTDPGSFVSTRESGSSAFITGTGTIGGRVAVICATETRLRQSVDIIDGISDYINALKTARSQACPFVLLLDSGPRGDSAKQLESLKPEQLFLGPNGMGGLFYEQARLAGQVPRLGAVLGPVAASRSFMVALCDYVAFVRGTGIAMVAPAMIKQLTGESTDFWQLGGADVHFNRTGMADVLTASEEEALDWLKQAVMLLAEPAAAGEGGLSSNENEMTLSAGIPFATPPIRQLIRHIADEAPVLEFKSGYRLECITALARVEGQLLGIIANNANEGGGLIHPETADKLLPFVDFCDSFSIPLLFLVDTPGFVMGRDAEWRGIIKAGGALFSRLARMHTRHLVIVVNKAFSAGLYAMGGAEAAAGGVAALPGASILFYEDRLLEFYLETPFISEDERAVLTDMLQTAGDPEQLVERGRIDRVLELHELRAAVAGFMQGSPPRDSKPAVAAVAAVAEVAAGGPKAELAKKGSQ